MEVCCCSSCIEEENPHIPILAPTEQQKGWCTCEERGFDRNERKMTNEACGGMRRRR